MKLTSVLYVFQEMGRGDIVKIGTCSKGGKERFREGAFMNPRQIDVVAMWAMPDVAASRQAERRAHKIFKRVEVADGREWFFASPAEAVERVSALLGRMPDCTSGNLPFSVAGLYDTDDYDEFREKRDLYKKRLVQRRIWLHQEQAGPYIKISHNTWWCEPGSRSTNAKRTTYNTFRLQPAACLAVEIDEHAPNWESQVCSANAKTLSAYAQAVSEFGLRDCPAGRVGWTKVNLQQVMDYLGMKGFSPLKLDPVRPPRGVKSLRFPMR